LPEPLSCFSVVFKNLLLLYETCSYCFPAKGAA
jgi:hypothetical protein